jgi:hypothetical protein
MAGGNPTGQVVTADGHHTQLQHRESSLDIRRSIHPPGPGVNRFRGPTLAAGQGRRKPPGPGDWTPRRPNRPGARNVPHRKASRTP